MNLERRTLDENDSKLSDFAYLDAAKALIRKGFNATVIGGETERRYRIKVTPTTGPSYSIGVGTRRKVRPWDPDLEATKGVQAMIGVDYSNSPDYTQPEFYIALVDSSGRAPMSGGQDAWHVLPGASS